MTGPTTSPEPVNHVFPVWDFVSGHMIALGLLAAERHRRLTGQGQLVKIALKDVALAMLGNFGMIAGSSLFQMGELASTSPAMR